MIGRLIALVYLFSIIFLSAALKWTVDKSRKGCECAQNWRLQYMKFYFSIVLLLNVILFIAVAVRPKVLLDVVNKYSKLLLPVFAASIFSVSVSLSYFVDIEKSDCACAKGPQERIMYYTSIFKVVFLGLQVGATVLTSYGRI